MKQKLLSMVLCVAMVGTFVAGCGNANNGGNANGGNDKTVNSDNAGNDAGDDVSDDTSTPDAGAATDEHTYEGIALTEDEVELTIWESTMGADEFVIQAGEKFTEMYPNIKINFVNVELGDSSAQIALDGPGGVGPDLFATPNNTLGTLVVGGHILPVQNGSYVEEKALGSCSAAVTYEDQVYGYPISADTYALFYNKALISEEEVPTTFDELVAWSTTFNEENAGKHGYLMNVGEGYYSYIFTTKDGNRIFGPSGDDGTVTNMNNDIAVEGMKYFQSLRSILDVPAADVTTAYCDGAFASGDAAMYLTGLWNVTPFREAGIDFGVAAIPCLPDTDTPPASFSSARTMCVSAYSDYPNEAAAFASFMMSDEMQALRFELTGTLPATQIQVDANYAGGFIYQLEYAFPCPSIPQMNNFWDPMNAATSNIWDGADVQTELDAANEAILAE